MQLWACFLPSPAPSHPKGPQGLPTAQRMNAAARKALQALGSHSPEQLSFGPSPLGFLPSLPPPLSVSCTDHVGAHLLPGRCPLLCAEPFPCSPLPLPYQDKFRIIPTSPLGLSFRHSLTPCFPGDSPAPPRCLQHALPCPS